MKVERKLTIGRIDQRERGVDLTRHFTGEERLSLLEDLRREVCKATGHENPQRLRRVLTIARRGER